VNNQEVILFDNNISNSVNQIQINLSEIHKNVDENGESPGNNTNSSVVRDHWAGDGTGENSEIFKEMEE